MTTPLTCVHPNGTRFTWVSGYKFIKHPVTGWAKVRDRDAKAGVWIEYPDGVRIFRPNEYYP